ncbi:ADP-ribosylation factor-like protein 16 [Trichechus manatus latirostris]|uniref:ADP-ribosylation factor-like protein 16 n=1 Tax=Trichechus manatus latirostris TaxID=127582 RepID=A0A2Y9QZT5_TRIMA|nr:ADP-ribosylation factor-like protein 16 [Trichechus manatus latirostris]
MDSPSQAVKEPGQTKGREEAGPFRGGGVPRRYTLIGPGLLGWGRALRYHGAELRVQGGEGSVGMCLLLGAAGVGKTLLVKRLQNILPRRAGGGGGRRGVPPVGPAGDLPCYMSVEEMKSLMRLPDIIARAKQNITTAEISARVGTGLAGVLRWLRDTHRTSR